MGGWPSLSLSLRASVTFPYVVSASLPRPRRMFVRRERCRREGNFTEAIKQG